MFRQLLRITALATIAAGSLIGCATAPKPPPTANVNGLMGPAEFQSLPSQPADHRIAYGKDPSQFADLRIPSTPGRHPVAILIHGGCWKADYASLRDMAPIADALRTEGIATWNVEYRRLPQPGSGWPGTYEDVGRGADYLRQIAQQYQLDLDRVVVVGHSAGGHLAMWVAARKRLPPGSALYAADPLPIRGVVDLAGPGDMATEITVEVGACQSHVVEQFLGGSPVDVPERYAQVSASKMLPLGVPQVLVWGDHDNLRPMWLGKKYAKAATAAGDSVDLVIVPRLGHFEVASPYSPAWPKVRDAIRSLLQSQ
ncbi:MAG TPA: alpha/beta hydrolase [Gemmataceae bacterium]|jgi:acetyl esterase/lipase|nr:alpha/beta hydrolase [Gemmataceae bacterium]